MGRIANLLDLGDPRNPTELHEPKHAVNSTDANLVGDQLSVTIRPPIAEELPGVAHLANQIQIQIGDYDRILIARRLRDNLPARIAKITSPTKPPHPPHLFLPHPIHPPPALT